MTFPVAVVPPCPESPPLAPFVKAISPAGALERHHYRSLEFEVEKDGKSHPFIEHFGLFFPERISLSGSPAASENKAFCGKDESVVPVLERLTWTGVIAPRWQLP